MQARKDILLTNGPLTPQQLEILTPIGTPEELSALFVGHEKLALNLRCAPCGRTKFANVTIANFKEDLLIEHRTGCVGDVRSIVPGWQRADVEYRWVGWLGFEGYRYPDLL